MTLELDTVFRALRLVPEFDGNPNVLTRFIQLCDHLVKEYHNVQGGSELINSALINGILNKIVGSAARLINSNGIATDWNGIRKALINNFADQRDETALYSDLSLLTQGSNTPQEFYERCQNLFSTIMTYVSLHDSIQTTIDAKRDLYKKLTLQAFVRGLKDPIGSRVRCMRPQNIEQALEFVHEETNTIYLQNRNDRLPDKRGNINNQPGNHFKVPSQPFNMPDPRPNNYSMPGPARFQFPVQQPPQWKTIYFQPRQFGPTRTQQMFRAAPPNFNRQNNPFQVVQQNSPNQPSGSAQPRPMSGVSQFVSRQLPPTNALSRHDWHKSGNPPPNNYFKTREMHFNDCLIDPSFNDFYTNDDGTYYDYYEYPEYYEYQPSPQEFLEHPQQSGSIKEDDKDSKEPDFQKIPKSDKLK